MLGKYSGPEVVETQTVSLATNDGDVAMGLKLMGGQQQEPSLEEYAEMLVGHMGRNVAAAANSTVTGHNVQLERCILHLIFELVDMTVGLGLGLSVNNSTVVTMWQKIQASLQTPSRGA